MVDLLTMQLFCARRPWDKVLNFLQERPHPLFNIPAAGLVDYAYPPEAIKHKLFPWAGLRNCKFFGLPAGFAALALVFLILFLVSALSSSGPASTGPGSDANAANISGFGPSLLVPACTWAHLMQVFAHNCITCRALHTVQCSPSNSIVLHASRVIALHLLMTPGEIYNANQCL